jgi:hypothetical protein
MLPMKFESSERIVSDRVEFESSAALLLLLDSS